jgi:hypothetical protein
MKSEARRLGRTILEKERRLDNLFAKNQVDATAMRTLTVAIGQMQGELRAVHLKAHIQVRALLNDHQIILYDQLRGYGSDKQDRTQHGKHSKHTKH